MGYKLKPIPYVTAEPYYFIFAFGYYVSLITLPNVLLHKSCRIHYNDTVCQNLTLGKWQEEQSKAHDDAAVYTMYLQVANTAPGVFAVLVWGPLSDKIGKHIAMIVPPLLFTVQSITYILLSSTDAHPWYIPLMGLLTGIYGDMAGATMMANSYLATSTRRSTRTLRFCILEGLFYLAISPSIIISGVISQYMGLHAPFVLVAILGAITCLYTIFILPPASHRAAENIDDDPHSNTKEQPPSPGLLMRFKDVYEMLQNHGYTVIVFMALLGAGLMLIATVSEADILGLYFRRQPFNYNDVQLAILLAVNGIIRGGGLILVSQLLIRFCQFSDLKLAMVGAISKIVGFSVLAFLTTTVELYSFSILGLAMCATVPSLRSTLSKFVDDHHHATMLSLYASVDVVCSLIGAILSNSSYRFSLHSFHGTPYLVSASFALMSFLVVIAMYYRFETIVASSSDDQETDTQVRLISSAED